MRWVNVFAGLILIVGVAAVAFPIFAKARSYSGPGCGSPLRHVANSLGAYLADNDDRFYPADHWVEASNWAYRNSDALPGSLLNRCRHVRKDEPRTGYAMNVLLDVRKRSTVKDLAETRLIYDSASTARDCADPVTSLPKPGVHDGKNAVLYTDGHFSLVINH